MMTRQGPHTDGDSHRGPHGSSCAALIERYKMETVALERMGLSLVKCFVSFCISKVFLSNSQLIDRWIFPNRYHHPTSKLTKMPNSGDDPAVGYADHAKFAGFQIAHIEYHRVRQTKIRFSVLVPSTATAVNAPVIVRFHGGYLSYSSRLHQEWFPKWLLAYAKQQGAVIITPDYRLLPEATGSDQQEDLSKFWATLASNLGEHGLPSVNTHNILVVGDSAGSHFAAISALKFNHQSNIKIRAVISGFGMLDMEHHHFSDKKREAAPGAPDQPFSIVKNHMESIRKSAEIPVVAYAHSDYRLDLTHAIHQHGLYHEFLSDHEHCYTRSLMANIATGYKIPCFWIYHGLDDPIVPIGVSQGFVQRLRTVIDSSGEGDIKFTQLNGGHGLDSNWNLTTPELADGLNFINQHWGR